MDLTVSYVDVRDEVTVDQNGATQRVKRLVFRIGTFGPFTERVPNDDAWQAEFSRRVDMLKRSLGSLPS